MEYLKTTSVKTTVTLVQKIFCRDERRGVKKTSGKAKGLKGALQIRIKKILRGFKYHAIFVSGAIIYRESQARSSEPGP